MTAYRLVPSGAAHRGLIEINHLDYATTLVPKSTTRVLHRPEGEYYRMGRVVGSYTVCTAPNHRGGWYSLAH